MDIVGLLGGAHSALTPALVPAQVRNTLWGCFERALEHASKVHDLNSEAIPALLIEELKTDSPLTTALLSSDLGDSTWPSQWKSALRKALASPSFTFADLDHNSFINTAFAQYKAELTIDARKPDSKLTNSLSISLLTARQDNPPTTPLGLPKGPFTNLWKYPRPAIIHDRPEVQVVQQLLGTRPPAYLIGGPGSGKSMVARRVADAALNSNQEISVWWMDGATRESLTASCAELCAEVGVIPDGEILTQTKNILARMGRWLIVVDDLGIDSPFAEAIPSSTSNISVLVTARSALGGNPEHTVKIGGAHDTLMLAIARDALGQTNPGTSLGPVIHACEKNPLAVATACRYLSATGASGSDLLKLIEERPDIVLDESLGAHYPSTFTALVRSALARLTDTIAADQLVTLSLCGARIRRTDLENMSGTDDHVAYIEGLRLLRNLGLIDTSEEMISCHKLISSVVLQTALNAHLEKVAHNIVAAIRIGAPSSDSAGLHEFARIMDHLPGDVNLPASLEVGARRALAVHLSSYGLGRTADRQLALARASLAGSADNEALPVLTASEAIVFFERGDIDSAQAHSRLAIEQLHDCSPGADATQWVLIQANMCLAQSYAYLSKWEFATQHAHYAVEASDGNSEVEAAAMKLLIPAQDARDRLVSYLKLAEDEELSPGSRAESYTMASRAALDLESPDQAVSLARQALALDIEDSGADSQRAARDLNDLGNALLATGVVEEAATYLKKSIDIYEAEVPEHGYAVQPRTHLARVLTEQALSTFPPSKPLLEKALEVLAPALLAQRRIAPRTLDMSSLLFAQANATFDHAEAIDLLKESLEIDRELFGDENAEVCIDAIQLATRYHMHGMQAEALEVIAIPGDFVHIWEHERPSLAVNYLSTRLLLAGKQYSSEEAPSEPWTTDIRDHLERLMSLVPRYSWEYAQAKQALALD